MRCMRKTTDNNLDDEEASISEEDKDSSRLENLHCTHYVITFTMKLEEYKCCCQYCSLLGDKLKDVKCITMNEKFKILCLNKTVLKASATRDRRYKNNFKTAQNVNNKFV